MSDSRKLPYFTTAVLSGLLFGAGLYVSQMVNPLEEVLRFLDFPTCSLGRLGPKPRLRHRAGDRGDVHRGADRQAP